MRGPYMDTALNWTKLKNDSRLTSQQQKTINKIVVALQVPVRDAHRNRPPINFNASGMTIAQVNDRLRKAVNAKRRNNPFFSNNSSPPGFKKHNNPTFNAQSNLNTARQHREAFGN